MVAFPEDMIIPYFQPIIRIDTRTIYAYEVLGRLATPQNVQSLGPFFHNPTVSLKEKVAVDRIIRRKAFKTVTDIDKNIRLFLNIQPQWLQHFLQGEENYPTLIYLQEFGLEADRITIEICESDYLDDISDLSKLIDRYRNTGCKIAIDDAGQGFSNFERILSVRADYLKVNAGLIKDARGKELLHILDSISLLSQRIGANIVLEGVENREQFLTGLRAGVRYFQGYFFSPAAPFFIQSDVFTEFIDKELEIYHTSEVSRRNILINISDTLNTLFNNISVDTDLNEYLKRVISFAQEDWCKIYICDAKGFQKTPNFVRNNKRDWDIQEKYINRNWCWRPYFHPYVTDTQRARRGSFSEPYFDIESHEMIWTFIYPLDKDFFLFLDCKYPIAI